MGKTGAMLLLGSGVIYAGQSAHAQSTGPGKAPAPGAAVAPRTVVLGQSVPLTGAASEIGLAFAAGAKLYTDQFNESSATSGIQLKLLQLDDGYDPARATANARKLLSTDKADMLFGFVGTASSEAGATIAAADNLRSTNYPNVFHV